MTTETPDDIATLRNEVRELVAHWRENAKYTPRSDNWLRGFDPEFSKALAARRLIGVSWPTVYGGRGLSATHRLAVSEELLRAGAPVAAHWVGDRQIGPAILRHGGDELKKEILPGIVESDFVFCLGMSEPSAGSDLAAVGTYAKPADGGWIVNGRKIWTSGAHAATHMYLLARTDREVAKHRGLTEFIVDMDSDGISVSPIVDITGERHFNEVLFEDVFVPAHRVLGAVGNGWKQVVEQLSFERGGPERFMSTYPLLAGMLEVADPADTSTAILVGSLVARLTTLRRLAFEVASEIDKGQAPVQQSATLKYLGNAFELDVIEAARTVLPPSANRPDGLLGHSLLAAPGFTVRGGAAEVLLGLIAREEKRA
jgi:alkylation response protein AidB-like acyl-CoA dehydrogenase